MNATPAPAPASSSDEPHDPWQEMSQRAKLIARTIEEKVRKATGETPAEGTVALAPTDELPPLTTESPALVSASNLTDPQAE